MYFCFYVITLYCICVKSYGRMFISYKHYRGGSTYVIGNRQRTAKYGDVVLKQF